MRSKNCLALWVLLAAFCAGCSEDAKPVDKPRAAEPADVKKPADKVADATADKAAQEGKTPAKTATPDDVGTLTKPGDTTKSGDIAKPEQSPVTKTPSPSVDDVASTKSPVKIGGQEFDTKFIPQSATNVVIVHPQRVLTSPLAAKLDLKSLFAKPEEKLGFAFADVKEVMAPLVVIPSDEARQGGPPNIQPGVIVHMAKPIVSKDMLPKLMDGHTPVEEQLEGKTVYRPGPRPGSDLVPPDPYIYLVDDSTFIIGSKEAVQQMLAARDVQTPLIDELKRVDLSADFISVFDVPADLRKQYDENIKGSPGTPPIFQPFLEIPDLLKAGSITVKLMPEISVAVSLQGNDEAAAGKLAELLKQAQGLGASTLPLLHKSVVASAKPDDQSMLEDLFQRGEKIVANIKPKQSGDRVDFELRGAGTLDDLAPQFLAAVNKARQSAERMTSMNNLRQLTFGFLISETENVKLPARANFDKDGKPLLSWRVHMLKYVEGEALYQQFHLDEPWDSEHNKALIEKMPEIYKTLGDKSLQPGMTRYLVPTGPGGIFEGTEGISLTGIKDGTSHTILLVEVGSDKAVPWTKPDDLAFDPKDPFAALGKIGDGFSAAMADGSVRHFSADIKPETLRKLLQRNDGEVIDETELH